MKCRITIEMDLLESLNDNNNDTLEDLRAEIKEVCDWYSEHGTLKIKIEDDYCIKENNK